MRLLYKKVDRRLYGHVAFYKRGQLDQESESKPYRTSSPFVIGRYSANGDGRLEVFGSVVFLLREIRRSIKRFVDDNNAWHARRRRLTREADIGRVDLKYDQKAMDFVILISTHARNLCDLIARFNGRSIPRLNYEGSRDGIVTLRELFDTLIHNRYYYFDGGCVRDLFSDHFKKKRSALSGRFMGYGFDIFDFVKGVSELIEEVTVKDLTQLLRWKFKRFTADSRPQDVVWLIQNVHAFSEFLQTKIQEEGYQFMMTLMFDELAGSLERVGSPTTPNGTTVETQQVLFESPSIGIASNLDKKEFEIRVRCAVGVQDQKIGREDLKGISVGVGFETLFDEVNRAFGDDHLITRRSQRLVPAAAN
ncbi:MAG: hypothetical protein F4151_10180 [Gammaproteobacteria bacterium]|nr:hypothetical protein [Gammaproteobacteria bacterium]